MVSPIPQANATKHTPGQLLRAHYFALRDELVRLQSEPDPHMPSIDAVILQLEQAQLATKATQGVVGNNPFAEGSAWADDQGNDDKLK